MKPALLQGLIVAALLAATPSAHALFGDDEARRAILELRGRVQQHQDESDQRLARIEAQLTEAMERLDQSSRLQLDNQAQFEQLRQEIAKLRGQLEVQAHEVATIRRQLGEQLATVDNRIKRSEPVGVEIDGRTASVDPEEKRSFEAALAQFRSGDFKNALSSFRQFQEQFPDSHYAPASWFWIGSSQFALKDYKGAIGSHETLVAKFPDNSRVPDALLNIGYAQAESGDRNAARQTLQSLIERYPQSPAAQLARDRLASLPSPSAKN
ncbi:MAG: tol-pal system protein YbgF [Limnobacter sp.]|nr:tol-pal system protein YbgF [Limnobacter sp.]